MACKYRVVNYYWQRYGNLVNRPKEYGWVKSKFVAYSSYELLKCFEPGIVCVLVIPTLGV